MYAAIRKYTIKPRFMEEVMQRIQAEFVFIIRQEEGFLDYYAARVGSNEVLTISVFDTQAGAEGSTPIAFKWVQENLARFIEGVPEATVGWVFAGAYGASPTVTNKGG
jgi:quinol monooxygenase YgiN